jgi:uncharacterized membrane protein
MPAMTTEDDAVLEVDLSYSVSDLLHVGGVFVLGTMAVLGLLGMAEIAAWVGIVGLPTLAFLMGTYSDAEEATESDAEEATESDDPIEDVRARYARGELSESEFERKLERLLETEDLEVPEGASEGAVAEVERE